MRWLLNKVFGFQYALVGFGYSFSVYRVKTMADGTMFFKCIRWHKLDKYREYYMLYKE